MKNIILIITLISINLVSCLIYPLNTSPSDIPDNAYIKDMNNELDKFVGVWKGVWNGKKIYLELKKNKRFYSGNHSYYIDEIVGERKIVASNGNVEIDRISSFDLQNSEFWGMTKSIKPPGRDRLTFYPKNMCRKSATLDIVNFTGTQMTLHLEYEPSAYDENCIHNAYVQQNGDFPINFPKDITLIKQ